MVKSKQKYYHTAHFVCGMVYTDEKQTVNKKSISHGPVFQQVNAVKKFLKLTLLKIYVPQHSNSRTRYTIDQQLEYIPVLYNVSKLLNFHFLFKSVNSR